MKKKIHSPRTTAINFVTFYPNTSLLHSIKIQIILIMRPNRQNTKAVCEFIDKIRATEMQYVL